MRCGLVPPIRYRQAAGVPAGAMQLVTGSFFSKVFINSSNQTSYALSTDLLKERPWCARLTFNSSLEGKIYQVRYLVPERMIKLHVRIIMPAVEGVEGWTSGTPS
jgi:hypothetical protein